MSESSGTPDPTPSEREVASFAEAPQTTFDHLQKRARLGALALSARTVVVQLVVLGGQIVLARRLDPQHFGVFAIVQFAMTFLTFFGDAGLGAALIQKKEEPSQLELSSVFYVQLVIGAALLVVVGVGAPLMHWVWPGLPEHSHWVLRALALNFLLTSTRVIPGLLMERNLQFVRIATLDTINSVVFYATAATMALFDLKIWSLVGGVLAQGAIATVLTFAMRPWRPSWAWSRDALKPLLRFGVIFQMHHALGLALSAVTPLFGGRVLGAYRVGLINWAQSTAYFPLQLVQIISRISFPLYSRLQEDRQALARAFERSLRACGLGTMVFAGLILGIAPKLVAIIYSAKWLEALPLLYLYAAAISIGFFTPVAATALEAIGLPGVVVRLGAVVTVLIWASVVPAAIVWGAIGFVSAYVTVMVLGNVAMVFIVRKHLPEVRVLRPMVPWAFAAVVIAVLGRWLFLPWISGAATLVVAIVALIVAFAGVTLAIDSELRQEVMPIVRRLRKA